MEYTFPLLPLKRMAIIRASSILLNCEVRTLRLSVNLFRLHQNGYSLISKLENSCWKIIERSIYFRVDGLPLPVLIKRELNSVIRQLFSQVWDWGIYCSRAIYGDEDILRDLYWTNNGVINKLRTLQSIIERHVHGTVRGQMKMPEHYGYYQLSYLWCLEISSAAADMIRNSCNDLSEAENSHDDGTTTSSCQFEKFLYAYYRMTSSLAAQYFWNKMPYTKRKVNALPCFHLAVTYKMTDFVCDILTCLDEEERTIIFRSFRKNILECFLHWPYQDFFIPTFRLTSKYFSFSDYMYFLKVFAFKLPVNAEQDNKCQEIMHVLWKECQPEYKRFLSENYKFYMSQLFEQLVRVANILTIKLIVNDSDINIHAMRLDIMHSKSIQNIIIEKLSQNDLCFVDNFVQVVFVSQEMIGLFQSIIFGIERPRLIP